MAPKGKSSRGRGGGQNTRATAAGGDHNSRAVAADPVESTRPAAAGGGETSRRGGGETSSRGGHQTSSRGGTRTCLGEFTSLTAKACWDSLPSKLNHYKGSSCSIHPMFGRLVFEVFMKDKDPDLVAFMSSSPLQQPPVIIPPSTQTGTLPDTTAAAVQPAGLTTGTTPTSPLSNTASNH
ncbi:unnamed protein product [Arabidopsis lyrata]|nr:unnamed protein product [Arabidopsis lyrata]